MTWIISTAPRRSSWRPAASRACRMSTTSGSTTTLISHELAGFGELTYHFTDRFWLTGGLRYGSVDAHAFIEGGYNSNYLTYALSRTVGPAGDHSDRAGGRASRRKASVPSYKLSASFQPIPQLTTYATGSTGFRAPVVNAFAGRASVVDPNDLIIPFGADTDKIQNYELGAKGRWLDGRLTTNLARVPDRLERHPGPGQPRVGLGAVRHQHRRGAQQGLRVRDRRDAGRRSAARTERLVQRRQGHRADAAGGRDLRRGARRAAGCAEVPRRGVRATMASMSRRARVASSRLAFQHVDSFPELASRECPGRRIASARRMGTPTATTT